MPTNRLWLNAALGVGALVVGWGVSVAIRATLDESKVLRFHDELETSDKQGYPAHWGR